MKSYWFFALCLIPSLCMASVDLLSNMIDATKEYKIGDEIDSKFDYVLPLIERNTKHGQYDALSFWWKDPEPTDSYLSCKLWYEGANTIEYLSLGLTTYDKIEGNNLEGTHMLVGHAMPGGSSGIGNLTEHIFPNLEPDSSIEERDILLSDMNVTTTGREVNLLQDEKVLQNVILSFTLPLDFFTNQNILVNGENHFVFQSEDSFGVFRLNFNDVRNEAQGYSLDGIMVEDCRSDHFGYDYRMNMKMRTKFYWKVDNGYVNIMMKHKGLAWLAWGVAKDDEGRMVGSEVAIAKWSDPLSEGIIKKYHLEGTSKSMVEEMDKTHQTLENWTLLQQDGETIIRFSKLLKEKGEHTIFTKKPNTFVYAVGVDNTFSQHAYAESFRIDLNKCPYTDNGLEVASRKGYKTFVAHGFFGAIAFGFLVPFSIGSAWFRDIIPDSWFKFHVYANLTVGGLTILSFLLAYIQTSLNKGAHFSESHHKVGLALFILVLMQIIGGLTRITSDRKRIPSELVSDTRYFSLRERWDALHKAFGITVLIIGLVQVGTGFNTISKEYDTRNSTSRYIAYVVLMSILIISMKRWTRRGDNSSVIGSENDLELSSQVEGSFVNNSGSRSSPRTATHTPVPNEII